MTRSKKLHQCSECGTLSVIKLEDDMCGPCLAKYERTNSMKRVFGEY